MSDSDGKCPTPERILKYFYMELDEEEVNKIESHFSVCTSCISEYDYYGEFIEQITPSARVQKELWLNANTDTFYVAAAASYDDDDGTSEILSKDGKYLLKKIPYMDDASTSLLVVKLMNPCRSGRISVYLLENSTSFFIGSELTDDDNKVCFEVCSDMKLTKLLVTFI